MVDLPSVEVFDGLLELVVIEDAGEQRIVLVHSADDGLEEVAVEDQFEIVDGVVASLVGDLGIGEPIALVLVEQKLIGLGELESEPFVEGVDDLGEGFEVRKALLEAPSPNIVLTSPVSAVSSNEPLYVASRRRWVSST